MKCYICAKKNVQTDAVAICITCGMGVCMDHAIREEHEVYEEEFKAIIHNYKKKPQTLPRFMCEPCHVVFEKGTDNLVVK